MKEFTMSCQCGSSMPYMDCCGLFLDGQQVPATPEQLMRSRYTAYCLNRMDYIKKTMKDKASLGFNEQDALEHNKDVTWVNLDVLQTYLTSPSQGYVEFVATYLLKNQLKRLHELSEFHLENDRWFYVDGTIKASAKISRNAPCPCGSQKKFKNCHGK